MMKNELPSLITPDTRTGMALAGQLADRLHAEMEQTDVKEEWLGGMSYLTANSIPKEIVAGILFYAIAAANQGWAGKA